MGQSLLPLLRPAYENTPELAELALQARAQVESRDALKHQIEFDDKVTEEISSLKLTDSKVGALERLLSGAGPDVNSKSDPAGAFRPVDPPAESSQNRSQA